MSELFKRRTGEYLGSTFYICFGTPAGFHIRKPPCFGVCLNWVSIGFMPLDIENVCEDFAALLNATYEQGVVEVRRKLRKKRVSQTRAEAQPPGGI